MHLSLLGWNILIIIYQDVLHFSSHKKNYTYKIKSFCMSVFFPALSTHIWSSQMAAHSKPGSTEGFFKLKVSHSTVAGVVAQDEGWHQVQALTLSAGFLR